MITHPRRHRSRKAVVIGMAILHTWCATITPARAFAPVAVLAAPQIVTAGASYIVGALAGIVGIVGMYLTVKDALDNEVAIPLGSNERNEVPAPSAPATATPTGTTPIEGMCGRAYSGEISGGYQESCAVCTSGWATWGPNNICIRTTDGQVFTDEPVVSCPTGYSASGGGCVLAEPRKVTDDKRCDLLLQNGQFATADDLNCGTDVDGTKAAPLIRDGKAVIIGTNSSGQPLIITVSPSSTIGDREWVTVTTQEQVQTATQTQVKTTTATIDPQTSTVTGVQTQTKPGVITLPSGGTIPTTDTGTGTTPDVQTDPDAQADVTVNTCGLPGQPACAIDDTGFSSQSKPWETQGDGPDMDDIKDKIANVEAPDIGFDWLPSIFPGQSVQCHPLDIEATVTAGPAAGLSASAPLDLCPYYDYVRMFLGFIFGVGAVLYIWKKFTGAREEVGEAF